MAKDNPKPTAVAQDAPAEEVEIEQPIPSGSAPEEAEAEVSESAVDEVSTQASAAPVPTREYVVLNGPASFGPVTMNGQSVRARAGVVYHLPDAEERADVLGTGVFRGAGPDDVRKAGVSVGPITRESLPPGALKGGLR